MGIWLSSQCKTNELTDKNELIKKYLAKISSSDSIFKATETDYAWENNRKLEFIKGENFYLKQSAAYVYVQRLNVSYYNVYFNIIKKI